MSLLEVSDLSINFKTRAGVVHAVEGVNFKLQVGEVLGIAGESGCGKTTSMLSIPGLLPANARIVSGQILFEGEDLLQKSNQEMEEIRWKDISVVFQGAMNALNPVHTIRDQIREPIQQHVQSSTSDEIDRRVKELVEMVGISTQRLRNYPHEFSGGMRQRVMIAMALACNPKLVIADEPVTALDVMIQAQILALLKGLRDRFGLAMILISHDLSVIAETCNRVVIMYAGKVIEQGEMKLVFTHPSHPYSQGLLGAFPNIYGSRQFVSGIPGYPPDLSQQLKGCRFYARCPVRMQICSEVEPQMTIIQPDQQAACHLHSGVEVG
jgi:peptide/nickel transport system ATP-binding protein